MFCKKTLADYFLNLVTALLASREQKEREIWITVKDSVHEN